MRTHPHAHHPARTQAHTHRQRCPRTDSTVPEDALCNPCLKAPESWPSQFELGLQEALFGHISRALSKLSKLRLQPQAQTPNLMVYKRGALVVLWNLRPRSPVGGGWECSRSLFVGNALFECSILRSLTESYTVLHFTLSYTVWGIYVGKVFEMD